MNSPVRSLDKPKNQTSWLRFGLKQNWQQFVFYAIVMLLACVVTTIISVESFMNTIRLYEYSHPENRGGDIFRDMTAIFAVVSCVLGIFAGMSATGYVNSRRAVHLYHSLPLTRESLYLTGSAVQGIYYLITGLVSLAIGTVDIALRLGISRDGLTTGLLMILVGIGGYLLVFSLFQLAGSLTGTAVFRFITAGLIAFLPVSIYLLVIAGAGVGMDHILVDNYVSITVPRFLCPAVNLYYCAAVALGEVFEVTGVATTILNIGTLYLTAAIYYFLGLYFHKKRRSELSENSVVWKKLQNIVKYPVIFVGGVGGALFFRALMGGGSSGFSWILFGCLCGLLLSFLLMNVLISRNTKSMFKGLPGLGATTVVVAVFLAIFLYDVFGFDTFMYETDQVKAVTIQWDSMTLELTDEDDIAAVMPYIQNLTKDTNTAAVTSYSNDTAFYIDPDKVIGQEKDEAIDLINTLYPDRQITENSDLFYWIGGDDQQKYSEDPSTGEVTTRAVYSDSHYGGDHNYTRYRIEVSVYPKHGLPVHRWMRVNEVSPNAAIFGELKQMTAYQNQYLDLATVKINEDVYDVTIEFMDESMWLLLGSALEDEPEAAAAYYGKVEELLHTAGQFDMSMTSTPVIGQLQIGYGNHYTNYPLYAGMTNFWDAWLTFWNEMPSFLAKYGVSADEFFAVSVRDYYDMLRYTNYTLYDSGATILDWVADNYEGVYVIEADTGRALYIPDVSEILSCTTITNVYTAAGEVEHGYLVVARQYSTEDKKAGEVHADGRSISGEFFADKVPQYILDAFAE